MSGLFKNFEQIIRAAELGNSNHKYLLRQSNLTQSLT